jgi:hypothetical protein
MAPLPAHRGPHAGRPWDDAVLITCSYVHRNGGEWVEKSLLLTAMGESDDSGAKALETFAHWYAEAETVFTFRAYGEVELCRLELGRLVPVEEDTPAEALRVVQGAVSPAPVATPRPLNLRRSTSAVTRAPGRIGG